MAKKANTVKLEKVVNPRDVTVGHLNMTLDIIKALKEGAKTGRTGFVVGLKQIVDAVSDN